MFKKLFTSLLLLSAAVLVLTACVPVSSTASFNNTTPAALANMTTREAQVDSLEVKVRQSQPTAQIDAIVRGHLTEACAVLSEPAFAYADHTFQIKVLASSPTDRGCAQITSQFESDFPLNAVDLQAGTYTVTVNGLSKVFTLTPPNLSTPDTSTVPAAFCSDPVELDAHRVERRVEEAGRGALAELGFVELHARLVLVNRRRPGTLLLVGHRASLPATM